MSFVCKICRQTFEEIPSGATKIGENRCGYQLYRFPGRQSAIHDLKVAHPEGFSYRTHLRWHVNRNIMKPDCGFCNSPKPDNPVINPPEPATELLTATLQALSQLPTPKPVEPEQLEPEPKQPESETVMSMAFKRLRNN